MGQLLLHAVNTSFLEEVISLCYKMHLSVIEGGAEYLMACQV